MKIVWTCENGEQFDAYEKARDDAREKMSLDDLANFFHNYVNFTDLFKWASKQENFWTEYGDDLLHAEEDYFTENYWKIYEFCKDE